MSLSLSEISSPEEFTAWDEFVAQHPGGSFTQLSGWAKLKQQFEWQPHILVVKQQGNIIAGAAMMDRSGLFGKKVSYVPYGPLVNANHHQAWPVLIDGLILESRQSVVLRIEPHVSLQDGQITEWQEILNKYGFKSSHRFLQPESTLLLDTTQTEDQLQAGMRQTTRRYIRQAQRAELEVTEDITGDKIEEFYQALQQVNQRRQFGIHTREYYQAAWNSLKGSIAGWQGGQNRKSGSPATKQSKPLVQPYLFFIQKNEQVLGAYFVVRVGHKSWELYGGVNEAGMKLKANYLLKWHSILAMKRDGVTVYDQWGIAPNSAQVDPRHPTIDSNKGSHPLQGVTYFKEGFGGQHVAYVGSYDKVNQPVLYSIARAVRKL